MTRILVTNGGTHPPAELAMVTAQQLTETAPDLTTAKMVDALKLRVALAEALTPLYEGDQSCMRHVLREGMAEPDINIIVNNALYAVLKATAESQWRDHYSKPNVQEVTRYVLTRHFTHARAIERSWHRDREGQN